MQETEVLSAPTVDLIGNRTLRDLVQERTLAQPDKAFVVFEARDGGTRELTYSQFSAAVDAAAHGFIRRGVDFQDRVILHMRNSPEFLIAWFALASIGAVTVPSNNANTGPELRYMAERSEAVAAITEPEWAEMLVGVAAASPALTTVAVAHADSAPAGTILFEELLAIGEPDAALPQPSSEDMLQILFTSGTTAKPKGVVVTHANALWAGERVARGYGLDHHDRCLTALPLFHVNAQSVTVLGALTVGGTCVLLEEFSASRYLEQACRHGATQTSFVATQAKALLAQPERSTDREHELRRVSLAINISEPERQEFERRFGVELINLYGLTEAAEIVALSPLFGPRMWPSLGLPAFDRRVKIVDEYGNALPIGEVGEIVVHGVPGRTVMREYFKDPDATAQTLVDGWVHTGDVGRLDEKGYLYFADRKKDVIKRAGDNVSATEVEAALVEHPLIVEAAVVGVPDSFRDEAVKAYLVVAAGETLTAEQIESHCTERLARFKVPTEIEFRDKLPRNAIGKLQKHLL